MILDELDVKPIINARGTFTVLGGSVLDDEIMYAIDEVRKVYVDMDELNLKAGRCIAKMIGVEAAFVTSGAEAGLVLAIGACMTKGDTEKMSRLPNTERIPNEMIVQKIQRNIYDYGLEIAGARLIEVGTDSETSASDIESAIGENTSGIVYFAFDPQSGVLPLPEVIKIAREKKLPVIVDAAGELPPKENLKKFTDMGADLVVFSGGKDLGGPNDTGLILGSENLIAVCRRLGPHSYETVDSKLRVYFGRPMKTSKEDIVATVIAVKRYLSSNQSERMKEWNKKADYISSELSRRNTRLDAKIVHSSRPRPAEVPKVQISPRSVGISCSEFQEGLKNSDPPVYTYAIGEDLIINTHCLKDGEEKIVVEKVLEVLSKLKSGQFGK
jgi:uncharacterized pyridoxal phosphate-dependent enzyme